MNAQKLVLLNSRLLKNSIFSSIYINVLLSFIQRAIMTTYNKRTTKYNCWEKR